LARENMYEAFKRIRGQRVKLLLESPGDTTGTTELPFQVGIIGDFTGHERTTLPPLENREFADLGQNLLPKTMADVNPLQFSLCQL